MQLKCIACTNIVEFGIQVPVSHPSTKANSCTSHNPTATAQHYGLQAPQPITVTTAQW